MVFLASLLSLCVSCLYVLIQRDVFFVVFDGRLSTIWAVSVVSPLTKIKQNIRTFVSF